MKARLYRLANGSLVTVEQTPNGIIVRDRSGQVVTVTTGRL
jgi:hypothetical protein